MSDNSSTSSNSKRLAGMAGAAKVVVTTLLFVALFDAGLNVLFKMPEDPRVQPNRLQQYFNYGRSIESKLRYMVKDTNEASAPIVKSGWIASQSSAMLGGDKQKEAGRKLVAIYGQSMSHRVGHQLQALDETIDLRLQGGPAAPLSHSYELFRLDRGKHQADVVLFGVVASGLHALTTMTTMGWAFEVPAPYTYPRWIFEKGELLAIQPKIRSIAELRNALNDPAQWQGFTRHLQAHDLSYSSILFNENLSDYSAVLRLAKRGLGQRHQDAIRDRYMEGGTFKDVDNILSVARALLQRFAFEARADGALPVVILFHDQGTGDSLYRAVSETLIKNDIPFISTHEIAPAGESTSFLPDGHFRRNYDTEFARGILQQVQLKR